MNIGAVLAGVLVLACVAGCEERPPVLNAPPAAYIAVDGTTHGVLLSGQRVPPPHQLYYTGVGVVGTRCLLVGAAADLTGSNVALFYDIATNTTVPLDTSALGRLDSFVGIANNALILVGDGVVGVVSTETADVTIVPAPGAESPAFGIGDGPWLVLPRRGHTQLVAMNMESGVIEDIPLRGDYVSPVGVDGECLFIACDHEVYSLRRSDGDGRWLLARQRGLLGTALSVVVVDGMAWALSSSDYPSRTYWEAVDGSGLYVAGHGIFQASAIPKATSLLGDRGTPTGNPGAPIPPTGR